MMMGSLIQRLSCRRIAVDVRDLTERARMRGLVAGLLVHWPLVGALLKTGGLEEVTLYCSSSGSLKSSSSAEPPAPDWRHVERVEFQDAQFDSRSQERYGLKEAWETEIESSRRSWDCRFEALFLNRMRDTGAGEKWSQSESLLRRERGVRAKIKFMELYAMIACL